MTRAQIVTAGTLALVAAYAGLMAWVFPWVFTSLFHFVWGLV